MLDDIEHGLTGAVRCGARALTLGRDDGAAPELSGDDPHGDLRASARAPGPRGLPPPPDGRSPPGRSPPERGPAERGAKGRPPGLPAGLPPRGRSAPPSRGLKSRLGRSPSARGVRSSRGLKSRRGRSPSARSSRGLNGRLGRSPPGLERGLALAQPSFLAGRFSASSTAASAARVRLGLRDGSDMGEPDLPRTTDPAGRRPGTGAGVSTVLPWGRFSGRMYWASISRITRGPPPPHGRCPACRAGTGHRPGGSAGSPSGQRIPAPSGPRGSCPR